MTCLVDIDKACCVRVPRMTLSAGGLVTPVDSKQERCLYNASTACAGKTGLWHKDTGWLPVKQVAREPRIGQEIWIQPFPSICHRFSCVIFSTRGCLAGCQGCTKMELTVGLPVGDRACWREEVSSGGKEPMQMVRRQDGAHPELHVCPLIPSHV